MADQPFPAPGTQPFVSVVIPVYNDADRLRACLAALERQTYPAERYEVIVVDNGSTPPLGDAVQPYPHAVAIAEPMPGSYAARNTGLARARGEVIAFTDSDCLPEPNWLEAGVRRLLETPNVGLLAGRVDLFFRDPARPTAVELYERVTAFPQQKFAEKYHFGATANVFTFRAVLERVGRFDATLKSGGDREWGQRAHAAGFAVVYADEVRVRHPARAELSELYGKMRRTAGGLQDLSAKPSATRFAKGVLKDALAPWKDLPAILSDARLENAAQKLKVVLVTFCIRYLNIWIKLLFRYKPMPRARA